MSCQPRFARMKGTLLGLPFHCQRTRRRAGALGKNVRPTRYFGSAETRLYTNLYMIIGTDATASFYEFNATGCQQIHSSTQAGL